VQARNLIRFAAAGVLSSSLFAGCATVEEDFEAVDSTMAPLVTVDAAARIPDQYIVVFKDSVGTKSMGAAMNRISLQNAKSRVDVQFDIIPAFSARLAAEDLAAIRRNPDVAYVEQDQLMFATATKPSAGDLEIDRHDHCAITDDSVFNDNGCNGSGVLVYIVDTGIRATHNEYNGRVNTARGFTAIADGQGTNDCNGHGSHVSSTAAGNQFGLAPGATLVPVRVLACNGSGSNTGVINGVNHVANNCGATERCVANMSLGGGVSTALDSAVANAVSRGIPFAVAAGNNNADAINFSPAREPSALTVGALSDSGYPGSTGTNSVQRASFSNFGSRVDIWASGLTILGAAHTSNTATQTISGTSMASPHVAGAVAQMLSCTGRISPAQVETNLNNKSVVNAISNESGGEDRILCSDWIDGDGNACACGNPPPPPPQTQCQLSNSCGLQDPTGCFCDAACVQFGDCCPGGPC
jgi:subtilisin family serine protease